MCRTRCGMFGPSSGSAIFKSQKGVCRVPDIRAHRRGTEAPRHLRTMVVAAFVVPVAIAYACNPQAHVSLDKTSYQPGSAITVHGSYFTGNSAVTVSGPTGS